MQKSEHLDVCMAASAMCVYECKKCLKWMVIDVWRPLEIYYT